MCLGNFIYSPTNFLFQAIKSCRYTRVQIHTRLDEYVIKKSLRIEMTYFLKFKDRNNTPPQVCGPDINFTLCLMSL